MAKRCIGVLWPDEDNFELFREVSGLKSSTLEEYRAAAGKDLAEKEQLGFAEFIKLSFDVEKLIEFARREGLKIDSSTRAEYAAALLLERDRARGFH